MKNSSHVPTESFEKQHYKRRYLDRKLAEQDADNQIKEFKYDRTSTHRTTDFSKEMQDSPYLD